MIKRLKDFFVRLIGFVIHFGHDAMDSLESVEHLANKVMRELKDKQNKVYQQYEKICSEYLYNCAQIESIDNKIEQYKNAAKRYKHKGDDTKAKQVMREVVSLEQQREMFNSSVQELGQAKQSVEGQLDQLEGRITEAESEVSRIKTQARVAESRQVVASAMSNANGGYSSNGIDLNSVQEKLNRLSADAKAQEQTTQLYNERNNESVIEQQPKALEFDDQSIEQRLSELDQETSAA